MLIQRRTQKRLSDSFPFDWLWRRRIQGAGPGKTGLSQSPEKSAITEEIQQRFIPWFSPNCSGFRVEELHLAISLGTQLPCHTIWPILLLSLVICCSTISCRGDFSCALGFLYKKKTKTLPRNACLPYVVFDFLLLSLFCLVESSRHPIKINHHVHLRAPCQRQFCKISSPS